MRLSRNAREHLIAAAFMIPVGVLLAICVFFAEPLVH